MLTSTHHPLPWPQDFSEWAQCAVLELASHYRPQSESEVRQGAVAGAASAARKHGRAVWVAAGLPARSWPCPTSHPLILSPTPASPQVYDILNALEDRLGATNSAVVVAAIKLFLHMTLDMAATHQQVRARRLWQPHGRLKPAAASLMRRRLRPRAMWQSNASRCVLVTRRHSPPLMFQTPQVLERIKDPLKTLIAREDPAMAYAVRCLALGRPCLPTPTSLPAAPRAPSHAPALPIARRPRQCAPPVASAQPIQRPRPP